MALIKIPSVTRVGPRITLLAALLAGGSGACVATAGASAGVEAPAPGLVVAGPDIQVVGDADAPDAYFVDGFYWQFDGEYWYRRPRPEVAWVVVETRTVPERIVVHEHEHHSAIVARHPGRAWRREEQAERKADAAALRQQAAEERARDAEREANAAQVREQRDRSAEKAANQDENRAARDAQFAEHREVGAEHREVGAERREVGAEHREEGAEHRAESAKRQETAAEARTRVAAERQAEQQRKQRDAQRRHDEKKH